MVVYFEGGPFLGGQLAVMQIAGDTITAATSSTHTLYRC